MIINLTPRTWGVGGPPDYKDRPAYDQWNQELMTIPEFLLQPPMCKLHQSSGQTIPNNAFTVVSWNTEDVDTDNIHSTITTPGRLIPKTAGWYMGSFSIGWPVFSSGPLVGRRTAEIRKNGSEIITRFDSQAQASTGSDLILKGRPFMFSANGTTDYIECLVYQDSGFSQTLYNSTNAEQYSEIYIRWYRA